MRKPKYKIKLKLSPLQFKGPWYKVVRLVGLESFQTTTSRPAHNHRVGDMLSVKQVDWLTDQPDFEVTIVV
jgi:hypothetical protein